MRSLLTPRIKLCFGEKTRDSPCQNRTDREVYLRGKIIQHSGTEGNKVRFERPGSSGSSDTAEAAS